MTGPTVVATARQIYNGRSLRAGDEFETNSEAEAADLFAMRMAVRKKTPPALLVKPTLVEVLTREVEAEPAAASPDGIGSDEAETEGTSVTGVKQDRAHYSRRDLRARK